MENYFEYFSEIEQRFQQRRGAALLLSTLDWALIESWKEQQVPLAAVLRGIDAAFDAFERRPRRTRKINSLAYCTQAVMEAAEQMSEAATGSARQQPALDAAEIAGYLSANAQALEDFAASAPAQLAPTAREIAASLRQMAAGFASGVAVDLASVHLEEAERRLTVLEEKFFAALVHSSAEADLLAARAEAERELAPFRRHMQAAQIEQLHKQFLRKRLLEKHALPRFSLFYMR